jgi:hypothetical protein
MEGQREGWKRLMMRTRTTRQKNWIDVHPLDLRVRAGVSRVSERAWREVAVKKGFKKRINACGAKKLRCG